MMTKISIEVAGQIVNTITLLGAATPVPQIGDTLTFKGLPLLVAQRSFSYGPDALDITIVCSETADFRALKEAGLHPEHDEARRVALRKQQWDE
jgi:hypothetical protein